MASSGAPSGRTSAGGSRNFDFGADDVLCSYDDFAVAHDPKLSDHGEKDFHDSRMGRPFVKIYEQESYPKEDVLSAVEKCMKKYADNLLRSLEGIGSRLSQLEIYCYKLDRSIGEFRSDILREDGDKDLKFKSLGKHLQEVHRSVQILRDKQELAETQKELAKLQFTQDSSKKNEEVVTSHVSGPKKLEDKPEAANQQLALVLPHQVNMPSLLPRASEPVQLFKDQPVQQPAPTSLGPQQDRYVLSQAMVYYPQRPALGPQDSQGQQVQQEVPYLPARPPVQDLPIQAASQQPQIVNQTQPQSFSPYQQQWHHQSSQQVPAPVTPPQQTFSQPFPPPPVQPQQSNTQQFPPPLVQPQQSNPQPMQLQHPSVQAQMRPQTLPNYSHYPPHQPVNPAPETFAGSVPMQGPYNTVAPSGVNRSEVVPFAYGGPDILASQPPPQHNMQRQQPPPPGQGSFGRPPSKGVYASPPHYAPQVNAQGYNTAYGYPATSVSAVQQAPQMPSGSSIGMGHSSSQLMHGHPYGEMIEKAITMGYPRDHVLIVTQRMVESGQQVDFNALLDRLNEPGSGGPPPRVW